MSPKNAKGHGEEEDLTQEPYPSPRFFLRPGEQVYLEALNVAMKKFQFHAYLTDQRIFLIDIVEKKVKATAKDIPVDTIEGCIVEVSPTQDPVLVLSIRQDDEIKQVKITFVQGNTDRSAEIDTWVEAITGEGAEIPAPRPAGARPVPAPEPEPAYEPEPVPQPAPARSRTIVIPQPKAAPPRAAAEPAPAHAAPRPSARGPGGVQQPSRATVVPRPSPAAPQQAVPVPRPQTRAPQQASPLRESSPGGPGRKPEVQAPMKTAMKTAMQPLRQPSTQPVRRPAVEPLREAPPPAGEEHAEYYDEQEGIPPEEARPDTIFCYNCGRKVLRIANFCPECGTRQTHPKETHHRESSGGALPERKPRPAHRPPPGRERSVETQEEEEYPEEKPAHREPPHHRKPAKKEPDSTILHKFLRR